jgi:hypothetical protein
MKTYLKTIKGSILAVAGLVLLNACDLDINDDPNRATGTLVTPNFIFPAVVATTVYNTVNYYNYSSGAYFVGHQTPGDGIAGFGDVYTYSLSSGFVPNAWIRVFDDLRDLQTIIRKGEEAPQYVVYGAISHVWKVLNYQLLVDEYGDVPYLEGLDGGSGNFTPKYDKGADVYKYLVEELDGAIKVLQANIGTTGLAALNKSTDPVFQGNLTKWIQFANNLKLKLLVRARGTEIDSFVQSAFGTFSSEGFLKDNVLANPGYQKGVQENPVWEFYHSSITGGRSTASSYYLPTFYVFTFYNGPKLNDPVRGALTYKNFPETPVWKLGDESPDRPHSDLYTWFVGEGAGLTASDSKGIVKSRTASAPVLLAAETYFLLAEAAVYGHAVDGDAKSNFEKGIEASFAYLDLYGENTDISNIDVAEEVADYLKLNDGSYLANFDKATTTEQKLEAIITQKYVALNILGSGEAWTEFRRTGYPAISGTDPSTTFVSTQSSSPRADKLPIRLIYPINEQNLNENAPKIRDGFTNPIFWDRD